MYDPTHLKCNLQDNKQILNYVFCWTFLAFSIQMFMFFKNFFSVLVLVRHFPLFSNIPIFHILLLNFFLVFFWLFVKQQTFSKFEKRVFETKQIVAYGVMKLESLNRFFVTQITQMKFWGKQHDIVVKTI